MIYALPSAADVTRLLDTLDTLPHAARQRQIAITCHALHHHGAQDRLDALLATLHQGDITSQWLAVIGARASSHTQSLRMSVQAPGLHIKRHALSALCAQPDALPHLIALLAAQTSYMTGLILNNLRAHDRRDLAPALIGLLLDRGDLELAASLLPLCDDIALLKDQLDALDEEFIPWKSLALRHPEVVLEHIARRLSDDPLSAHDFRRRGHYDAAILRA